MKLISMTDFVLENDSVKFQSNIMKHIEALTKILNYANFLKQPLKLSMFVPCDEEQKPLLEPKIDDYNIDTNPRGKLNFHNSMEQYKRAKEKVLFEEWVLITEWYGSHLIAKNSYGRDQIYLKDYISIENLLLDKDLDLTESAIKKCNLS